MYLLGMTVFFCLLTCLFVYLFVCFFVFCLFCYYSRSKQKKESRQKSVVPVLLGAFGLRVKAVLRGQVFDRQMRRKRRRAGDQRAVLSAVSRVFLPIRFCDPQLRCLRPRTESRQGYFCCYVLFQLLSAPVFQSLHNCYSHHHATDTRRYINVLTDQFVRVLVAP